jgi:hypothetical protein
MLQTMTNAVTPVAFADNSKLARNKSPTLRITRTVKAAIEAMVDQGLQLDQAASEGGITTRALRLALEKPHVMQFYRQRCQVLRGAQQARNIHRLAQIRDADDNMPAVNAIKALEQLSDEQTNNKQTTSPGVTIRIVNVTATPTQHEQTTIDAKADDC